MANWSLIGALTVSNSWQFFSTSLIAETFRITTTIANQDDWYRWKFRSAAYLRFFYADNSASRKYYIPVLDVPTVYRFEIPAELKSQLFVLRTPQIIRASRYLPLTPNDNFAQWSLKLEALQG